MEILVLGLNHKRTPIEIREKFAFSSSQLESSLKELKKRNQSEECVILSTCNRVEIYVTTKDPEKTESVLIEFLKENHKLPEDQIKSFSYIYRGYQAVEHLFKVACGLDALVLGENEILGQCKEAYHAAMRAETCYSILAQCFERAFQCAKEVKTKTRINEGATSVSSVAVELAERIFGKLYGEKVLVLGSGEMAVQTLKYLKRSGVGTIYVANRTPEHIQPIVEEFRAEAISFDGWISRLSDVDIVITATSAPHVLVKEESVREVMHERRHKPLFIIDIAVPRDVDAKVNEINDVYLYNVDDLKLVSSSNTKMRARELPKCFEIIKHRREEFMGWVHLLDAGPVIQRLDQHFEEILKEEVSQFFEQESTLKDSPEKMIALKQRLKNRLLQLPLSRIKQNSKNGSLNRILESLLVLFQLDRFQNLKEKAKKGKSNEKGPTSQ